MNKSIDGFVHRPSQPIAQRLVRLRPSEPLPTSRRVYAQPEPPAPRKQRLPAWIQMPLIILFAMMTGFLAQSLVVGQLIIILYTIAALIWRIASRTTFTIALISLLATVILLIGKGNIDLAQNFATYTFLLLVAGVITLGRELKKEGGRIYSVRERQYK